ncbi:MAG TPA: beta-N-acetylhexosaminidase, partial [Chitinophagaceae bacterium]|nr:beta-N-acetylhexosaminidase [Chitinophagaceae bacterium]
MRLMVSFLLTLLTFSCISQQVSIIPQPASLTVNNGTFTLSKKTVLTVQNSEDKKTADLFNEYLQQFYGFKLDVDRKEGKDYIRFTTRQFIKAPDKDGYTLNVAQDGVTIEGDTYNGTFYGMQSLIQLLPVGSKSANVSLKIPFVAIQDAPRFAYRGLHLDVCRHFFPLSFIKKYIDYIALHKMNYFHWHLTEDQGWRIEIKKYPRLTEVGGYRNGTIVGRYPGTSNTDQRYGGFYTQEEIKDIVQYAATRHITVVPEIEMPGHSSAAIAAYPWLSCFPDQPTKMTGKISTASQNAKGKLVQETWGVFDDVYCAGKDSTFTFLEGVLDEVIAIFPSKYIHIGGDESPKTHWKKCPNCQKRIKDEGLKDEHELQSYFIQRMEKYLNSKGKSIIGWDEILEGGLAPNATVMSWRGEKGGIEAAKQKHNVIMTPSNPLYFDHTQSQSEDSITIGGYNPIEKVYAYDPQPKELSVEEAKYIM